MTGREDIDVDSGLLPAAFGENFIHALREIFLCLFEFLNRGSFETQSFRARIGEPVGIEFQDGRFGCNFSSDFSSYHLGSWTRKRLSERARSALVKTRGQYCTRAINVNKN